MDRRRLLILGVLAILILVIMFFILSIFTKEPEKPIIREDGTPPLIMVDVLHTTKIVAQGSALRNAIEWRPIVEKLVSKEDITRATPRDNVTTYNNSIARYSLKKDAPIKKAAVFNIGDENVLSILLSPGMRAVAVETDSVRTGGALIKPGDYVDVILVTAISPNTRLSDELNELVNPEPSEDLQFTAKTIFENVRILAINRDIKRPKITASRTEAPPVKEQVFREPTTVTLELIPEDAVLLLESARLGEINLTLHGIFPNAEQKPQSAATDILQKQVPPHHINTYKNGEYRKVIVP